MRRLFERVPLDVSIGDRRDDQVVIAVRGEIDSDNCAELRCELSSALTEAGTPHVALDLSALTFIGSAGVRELLRCREEAEQRGGTFRITQAHDHVRQVLTLCSLTELLHLSAAPNG
ncbi:STAS domain-containing protein [Paractinoplanes lichenicola]|uniref:Anti-sigma factor antagonist n=1 Tax=Paractinoplanes lichenicola TaxID=2802976 RepID=A0ABS1VDT0_9ACTN|nr:STAS domain-containing protein [Actinoplanes lichenicola]MBL7252834.1 STAS domain-containing protein [Actinoplanes lichenicola]